MRVALLRTGVVTVDRAVSVNEGRVDDGADASQTTGRADISEGTACPRSRESMGSVERRAESRLKQHIGRLVSQSTLPTDTAVGTLRRDHVIAAFRHYSPSTAGLNAARIALYSRGRPDEDEAMTWDEVTKTCRRMRGG
jgi:hypothetical protein